MQIRLYSWLCNWIFGGHDEELLGRGDLFDSKTKKHIGFAIFFYCERCFKGRIQEHYFDKTD